MSEGGKVRTGYIDDFFSGFGVIEDQDVDAASRDGSLSLPPPEFFKTADPIDALRTNRLSGLVIEVKRGWPGRGHIGLARKVLKAGFDAWFFWPLENSIDPLDHGRIRFYTRLWLAGKGYAVQKKIRRKPWAPASSVKEMGGNKTTLANDVQIKFSALEVQVGDLIGKASPVPLLSFRGKPTLKNRMPGEGFYLRTDFWSRIMSGGSYGHTCYVAEGLAARTEKFSCFMHTRFSLLDEMGLNQVMLGRPADSSNEVDVLKGTDYYYDALKAEIERRRPAYIYERMALGNFAAARLSQEYGIPYIAEYNGSEISLRRSFDHTGYEFEDLYLLIEEANFRQATAIVCVSQIIADEVIARGIDPRRVLCNPNGASPRDYKPASAGKKRRLRAEFGWDDSHCVIGFIGSFGGWHGIDVLAEGIPKIAAQVENARFLLIGDGNFRHLVTEAVSKHGLEDRVVMTGNVPQTRGARLLRACDIYLSPHSKNMIDSPFFGSPTKLFEYMAMGGGIVASALEQIGEVLTPALRVADLAGGKKVPPKNKRAVLCKPGDFDEFVAAVVGLAIRPDLVSALGKNSRAALMKHYSWDLHVENIFDFIFDQNVGSGEQSPNPRPQPTGPDASAQVPSLLENKFREAEMRRYSNGREWIRELLPSTELVRRKDVLVVDCGLGTDVVTLVKNKACVTGLATTEAAANLAEQNLMMGDLSATIVQGPVDELPFEDKSFDIVYSVEGLDVSSDVTQAVNEMHRVLRPYGRLVLAAHAEHSVTYWRDIVLNYGLRQNLLAGSSVKTILGYARGYLANEAEVDWPDHASFKVFDRAGLRSLLAAFKDIDIRRGNSGPRPTPRLLRFLPVGLIRRMFGWSYLVNACKPGPRDLGRWPEDFV